MRESVARARSLTASPPLTRNPTNGRRKRMKVLIVAKTRQGSGACIGGITFDGRSVRLIPLVGDVHDGANLEYSVGDVWEVDATTAVEVTPPHVENVIVRSKRRMGPMTDLPAFVERHMPPKAGGPELLYEGLVQASPGGALYIAERTGVPPYSTLFWRCRTSRWNGSTPARTCAIAIPLLMADARSYSSASTNRPTSSRPAALVRVSLAHWWRREYPDEELRCFVQLSGYFLPAQTRTAVRSDASKSSAAELPSSRLPPPRCPLCAAPRTLARQL